MIILEEQMTVESLKPMAKKMHSNLVKAIDVDMHADAELFFA